MAETNGKVVMKDVKDTSVVDMTSVLTYTMTPTQMRVAVIGTGDFGRAIASRMRQAGVEVVVGSRNTSTTQGVVSVGEALQEKMVILAVPAFSHTSLAGREKIAPGTVIVDCSNRTKMLKKGERSQAEELQEGMPVGVHVVKAFNTLSAYQLEQGPEGVAGHLVPAASDSQEAKEMVDKLLIKLGFNMVDYGGLDGARQIEQMPLTLFPQWRAPLLVSTILWLVLYFLTFSRYQFCKSGSFHWNGNKVVNMPLKYLNKTSDSHALTLLAACYLPGVLAAYIQLFRGTKYSRFPAWLDNWLKMRKQLGLLMLLSASIHGCLYCLVFTLDWSVDWETSLFICCGVLGYFVAVILGITSLPSVSSSLSWREFRTIQSWLGWVCLILSTLHVTIMGWDHGIFTWRYCIFPSSTQLPLILPALTILLKLPLVVPMVDWRLTSIRQGKEFK